MTYTDNTTREQRMWRRRAEDYVTTHPDAAMLPTLPLDGTVSIRVTDDRGELEADADVREAARLWHLPRPERRADGHLYGTSAHGVSVYALHDDAPLRMPTDRRTVVGLWQVLAFITAVGIGLLIAEGLAP